MQARKKSDLKFSWEERDRGRLGEDWSLQKVSLIMLTFKLKKPPQVKIEGFDPAKFKAANKAGAGDSRAEVLVTAHISQHSFRWVDVVTVLGTVLMSPGRPCPASPPSPPGSCRPMTTASSSCWPR